MNPIITKSFKNAALALGLLGAPLALSGVTLLTPSLAHAESAPTIADMKQTLAAYGEFKPHAKYGEVWKPTVTPRGWHPYPACDWVFTKDYGWYFNDKTVWGAIVHHYGRWIHEASDGWLWVPGAEFSPGWVVWRTSAEWVGWAPTPPDAELTPTALEEFNDDKLWTFMDAKKFGATCEGGATTAQYGDIWKSTTFVTDIRFVGGVGVFVLPPAIIGPVVNVNIGVFAPWSVNFIGSWVWNWTNIFNDVDIDIVVVNNECKPNDKKGPDNKQGPNDSFNGKPLIKDISDSPPPPPPGKLRDLPRAERQPDADRVRQPKREVRSFDPRPDDRVTVDRQTPDRRFPGRRDLGETKKQRNPHVDRFVDENTPKRLRGHRNVRDREPVAQRRETFDEPVASDPGFGGRRAGRGASGQGRVLDPGFTPRLNRGSAETVKAAGVDRRGGDQSGGRRTFERFGQ